MRVKKGIAPTVRGLEGSQLYRYSLDAFKYRVTVRSQLRDTVPHLNNSVDLLNLKGANSSLANRNYIELQNDTMTMVSHQR